MYLSELALNRRSSGKQISRSCILTRLPSMTSCIIQVRFQYLLQRMRSERIGNRLLSIESSFGIGVNIGNLRVTLCNVALVNTHYIDLGTEASGLVPYGPTKLSE